MTATATQQLAAQIKLLILDVDGVLTDGNVWFNENGSNNKCFHTQDGLGLQLIKQAGIEVAIISGGTSPAVTQRMRELKISYVYQGQQDKGYAFDDLLTKLNLKPHEVAYVGDDLPDLIVMQKVGLSIAVANAVAQVKQIATMQTKKPGGQGAVREVCDFIINAKKTND